MAAQDDRIDKTLPVTAEVGGEGGSYADATVQADTFKGGKGTGRIDPKAVHGADADQTAVAAEGEQVRDTGDLVKHATEPSGKS
jgi:hypothetical protein